MTGYVDHYHKAKKEFVDWYYKGHVDKELSSFWFTNCYHLDDMLMYDSELKFALEAFDDHQVKLIYHHEIDEHCLKIKWEINPWWPQQVLHFYYSILLPIDGIDFKFPHELVSKEKEELCETCCSPICDNVWGLCKEEKKNETSIGL